MTSSAKLNFFCGKMAAGTSTLARALAAEQDALLRVQDELRDRLYPGEIPDIPDFVSSSTRSRRTAWRRWRTGTSMQFITGGPGCPRGPVSATGGGRVCPREWSGSGTPGSP